METSGNGVLSSFFGNRGAAVKTVKQGKTDLSAKVKTTDLTPEAVATSDNFVLIEGVLVGAVTITPAMAEVWLERNTDNIRNPMTPSIGEYAESMRKGQWDFNGAPISFDKEGKLADGQNRLHACIEAKTPFTSTVVYGIDSVLNIDVGRHRTLAQLLGHEGFSDSPRVSAVVNYLHNYADTGSMGFNQVGHGRHVLTKKDAMAFAAANASDINHSVSVTRKSNSIFNKWSLHATLHFLFARTAGQVLADEFYEKLISGAGLSANNPIFHLREKLTKEKARKNEKMTVNAYAGLIIKGWNYFISNQEISVLRYDYVKEKIAKIKRSPMSK